MRSSRQNFTDHVDIGQERREGRMQSVNEWDIEKEMPKAVMEKWEAEKNKRENGEEA